MKTSNAFVVMPPMTAPARAIEPEEGTLSIAIAIILIAPWIELLWLLAHIHSL
jgi:hypothetical protein